MHRKPKANATSMSPAGRRSQLGNPGREPWRNAWPPASRRLHERVAALSPHSNRHARNVSRVSPRSRPGKRDFARARLKTAWNGRLQRACPVDRMEWRLWRWHAREHRCMRVLAWDTATLSKAPGRCLHAEPIDIGRQISSAIRGTPAEGLADGEVVSERGRRALPIQSVAPNQYAIRVLRLG